MIDYKMIFMLLGGLGLFVYGMHMMSEGLQKAAGDKLKKVLEVLTTNRILGIIVGVIVTAITQSSSATTVMVIGFVNAGLMDLAQAASVIMGANIGTTITGQLIAFNFAAFAPLIIAVGTAMVLFSKKKKVKEVGEIVLGFGIIFLGMDTMGNAMKPLGSNPAFTKLIVTIGDNPFLGVLLGTAMTAVIQSSGAFIAMLIALSAGGSITFGAAFPMLLGSNIGTCITAILASIGTNKTAKRAAGIHLSFNVIGTIIFILLLHPVVLLVEAIGGTTAREIANAHTIFNVVNTLIQAPFIPLLVAFVNRVIPGQDDKQNTLCMEYIDKRLLETPSVAVSQVIKETVRMGRVAKENIEATLESFIKFSDARVEEIAQRENLINYLEREITYFLVQLLKLNISSHESEVATSLFHVLNDIERMGDHAENLLELSQDKSDHSLKFSDEAIAELKFVYETALSALDNAIIALENGDIDAAMKVIGIEEKIDSIEKRLRTDHIDRLNKGICNPESGTLFLDAISNLERIGDHSTNVAQIVMEQAKYE